VKEIPFDLKAAIFDLSKLPWRYWTNQPEWGSHLVSPLYGKAWISILEGVNVGIETLYRKPGSADFVSFSFVGRAFLKTVVSTAPFGFRVFVNKSVL